MFKSLFKRKKNESEDASNPVDDSQGTDGHEQQQQQPNQPEQIDEVLNKLCEDLDPWDREKYSVTVAEAQYLWARYKQLLQNDNKYLSDDVLSQEPFVSSYILRQIWQTIPRDENGCVTFPSFFGVIKWWQTVDQKTKLTGIFKLLNKAQTLDVDTLKQVFMKLETNQDEDTAGKKAELLVSHLDSKKQGFIDEEQWIQGMGRISNEELDELTKLYILPLIPEPSNNHILPTPSPSSPVPEEMLITISSKIGERDWKPLAKKLGFNEREIKLLLRQYPSRSREQAFQMLKSWHDKEDATKQKLDFALRRCGMDDVLFALQN